MTINELMDKAKTRANLPSDYALAKALGIDRSVVSQWRKGKKHPGTDQAIQLATLAGLEEMPVIAAIEYQTATTEKKKEFWRLYMHQHGISTVLVMVSLGFSIAIAPKAAEARNLQFINYGEDSHVQNAERIYIMRKRKGDNLLILKASFFKLRALFTFAKIHVEIKAAIP